MTIINLKEAAEDKLKVKIENILQATPGIGQAKRCLQIMREKTDYKFLKYYIHQANLPEYVMKA
jgi:hypothetical protein